ncbi:antileukoproteinase-like [Pantherophis guttatus]|uniref:Antileukoproteinase-like n=1 Tax=Pantherophis guttatus TaxID=94885 RepID=A0A6P9BEW0_PANGU|nr:antileukoproteinase-like [Pantherophis guttatus]
MKTFGIFLLIGFLVLWSEISSASGTRIFREKPGFCPFIREKCRMLNPPNDCDYDFQCSGYLKCCEGICGRECLPPVYG